MTMNDEMTEMGSVRPVMTVERQEFRKQNTIRTVSRPPSTSVFSTSATDSRMKFDVSRTIWISVPGGISGLQLLDRRAHRVHHADRVGLRLLGDVDGHRRLAVDERQRALLLDGVLDRSRRPTGGSARSPRRPITMLA